MIGAITGLAGSAMNMIGGFMAASARKKAMKQVQGSLDAQKTENENWYNRRYNEDATQRADAQAMIEKTRQSIAQRNAQAAATQAVMGGTDEAVAASREANNRALADTAAQIAVAGQQQKNQVEQQYQQKAEALEQKKNDLIMGNADNMGKTVAAMGESVAGMGGGLTSLLGNDK